MKICSKCGEEKDINDFQKMRVGKPNEYRLAYCRSCRMKQQYASLNNNIDRWLADKYRRLIARCKKYSIFIDLTKDEFIQQYYKQEGKCFYTGEKMRCEVGKGFDYINSLSIDKIIPEKGYVVGNVVFCTNRVNTAKSNFTLAEIKEYMPLWYAKLEEYI